MTVRNVCKPLDSIVVDSLNNLLNVLEKLESVVCQNVIIAIISKEERGRKSYIFSSKNKNYKLKFKILFLPINQAIIFT